MRLAIWFCLGAIALRASPLRSQTASPAVAPSPLDGATYVWTGMIDAMSVYDSPEIDGTPGKHRWTASFQVRLAEVPTTSTKSGLVNGQLVSVTQHDLLPIELMYRIAAFTDDRPYMRGPAHGGYIARGTATGKLRGRHLTRAESLIPGRLMGSRSRSEIPQSGGTSESGIWPSWQTRSASLEQAVHSDGGYQISIGLTGTGDWTSDEKKKLYDGITLTQVPCVIPVVNQGEVQELATAGGFLNRMELRDVLIFGRLTTPDQREVRGLHIFSVDVPDSDGYRFPDVAITWDLRRIPTRGPSFEVEYSQPRNGAAAVGQPAARFVDYLVGRLQPPIQVSITTEPETATVEWSLTPMGAESGTVTPGTGTSKTFSFTPNVTGVRPTTGSRQANVAVAYTLKVKTTDAAGRVIERSETIRQDNISILRQEYVDYDKQPPDRTIVGPATGTANFGPAEFTPSSNYAPLVVNGGMQDLAQGTRTALGDQIRISSAYRNPQRNRAISRGGGSPTSVHMTGGAVDMVPIPDSAANKVRLHRAAFAGSGAASILLERASDTTGGDILLPKNWNPPPAQYTFIVGNATVTVEDSNADDLPDRVAQIAGPPRTAPIPSRTNLAYAGGGTTNPNFRVTDANRNGRIDRGESLVLQRLLDGVAENALIRYYQAATHVHCDTGIAVRPLTGP